MSLHSRTHLRDSLIKPEWIPKHFTAAYLKYSTKYLPRPAGDPLKWNKRKAVAEPCPHKHMGQTETHVAFCCFLLKSIYCETAVTKKTAAQQKFRIYLLV